jgi:hypothetical protein
MLEHPHEQAVQPQGTTRPNYGVITLLLLVALAGAIFWGFKSHGRISELEEVVKEHGFQNDAEMKLEQERATALREEERRRMLATLEAAEGKLLGVATTIGALEKEEARWRLQSEALRTSDDGKRIAADEAHATAFHALVLQRRPGPDEVKALRTRLEHFQAAVKQGRTDESAPIAPSQSWNAEVEQLERETAEAKNIFEEHNRQLVALLERAESAAAGESTLQDALNALRRTWDQEELAAVEAAVAQARKEGIEKLAKEKAEAQRKADEAAAEKVRLAGEIAAQKMRDEIEKMKREEAARLEQVAAERKRAALEARFAKSLPEIRELLKPFISEGLTQPDGRQFRPGGQKGPVSLAALKRNGMLEPNYESLDKLRVATTANKTNDRPLGSFPDLYNKNWQTGVQRAQDLLNEFGELLVEKGMLAP